MRRPIDTWVVVPCFDEAARLRPNAFAAYVAATVSTGFIFVDDGSRDRTPNVLKDLCARSERLVLLTLPSNHGKAEAVRSGLVEALSRSSARVVGFWDADLASPLGEIARLRDVLGRRPDIDIVLGIRLPLHGHAIHRNHVRRLVGRTFAAGASVVLGRAFRDTQCGAKLFRVTPTLRAAVAEPFSGRWVFDVELLGRCGQLDEQGETFRRVYELPLEQWTSQRHSRLTSWSYFAALRDVLRIWGRLRIRRWRTEPCPTPSPMTRYKPTGLSS